MLAANVFADEVSIDANSQQAVEISAPATSTDIEFNELPTTTDANTQTVEQITSLNEQNQTPALENVAPSEQPQIIEIFATEIPANIEFLPVEENLAEKQAINPVQLIEAAAHAQSYIETIVGIVGNAAEEVQDIAEYIDDTCDAILGNDDATQTTPQTPEEVQQMQKFFTIIIERLHQKGFNDDQISELFEALTKMRDQNFTAAQIESFINGLITATQQPQAVDPVIKNYYKTILTHPATAFLGGAIVATLVIYGYKKIMA